MQRRIFLTTLAALTLASQTLLSANAYSAENTPAPKGKILLVASSPAKASNGWPVGVWAAEITHPYDELTHAGYQVDIVSTKGGNLELDAYSDPRHKSAYSADDIVSLGFLTSPKHAALLKNTPALESVKADQYDALIVAGGQAPMYTFRDNKTLQNLVRTFYESGKPTAALCHGVSSLVDTKLSNGEYLIKGKKVTGFSLAEDQFAEKAVGAKLFDWYIEPTVKERGANYVQGGMWADFAVNDGHLITGQQQHSGRSVARLVMQQLAK
jgi:putative intracellular protease/amidase